MVRREPDDEISMDDGRGVGHHDQATVRHDGEGLDGTLNVGGILVLDQAGYRLDPERWGQGPGRRPGSLFLVGDPKLCCKKTARPRGKRLPVICRVWITRA
jgi:hypothetical protein